jgi:hypothetical protein
VVNHGERLGRAGPTGAPPRGPRNPPAVTLPVVPAGTPSGSLGSPGRSALAAYRRRRGEELAAWSRTLAWRAPLVGAAGAVVQVLATPGRPATRRAGGLAAAVSALRAGACLAARRPRGAAHRPPAGPAGPRRLCGVPRPGRPRVARERRSSGDRPQRRVRDDSKQWTGSVYQGADGLAWHDHYRLDRTLETVRWEAETVGRLLGTRIHPLLCVHSAHVQHGGLHAQGVAIVPAHLLRSALGYDRVLSDADVKLLATTAWTSLRPAA